MDVQANVAPATGGSAVAPVNTTSSDDSPISIREAAQRVATRRAEPPKDDKPQDRAPNGRFAGSQAQESSPATGSDAAPQNEATGEHEAKATDPADELPPIDPPRSWSKADRERWSGFDRATQEFLLERAKLDSDAVRKAQNDAAENSKALTVKEQAAEHARQQYEGALNHTLQSLLGQQNEQFADIKTMADVQKLANDDPFRFAQWQARQMQIQALHQQSQEMHRQRAEKEQNDFVTWAKDQDKAFSGKVKDFADPEKAPKLHQAMVSYLTNERGIEQEQLQQLWNNRSFRDSRMQEIVYDAFRWNEAQKKAKAAAASPLPPVQRPGTAPSKGDANQATITALEQKLNSATTTRDQIAAAAALRAAKRANAR